MLALTLELSLGVQVLDSSSLISLLLEPEKYLPLSGFKALFLPDAVLLTHSFYAQKKRRLSILIYISM